MGAEPQMQLLRLRLLEPGAEPGAALSGGSKSRWAGSRKNSAALPTLLISLRDEIVIFVLETKMFAESQNMQLYLR